MGQICIRWWESGLLLIRRWFLWRHRRLTYKWQIDNVEKTKNRKSQLNPKWKKSTLIRHACMNPNGPNAQSYIIFGIVFNVIYIRTYILVYIFALPKLLIGCWFYLNAQRNVSTIHDLVDCAKRSSAFHIYNKRFVDGYTSHCLSD